MLGTAELTKLQDPNCAQRVVPFSRSAVPELFKRNNVLIGPVSFPFPDHQHPFVCDPRDTHEVLGYVLRARDQRTRKTVRVQAICVFVSYVTATI